MDKDLRFKKTEEKLAHALISLLKDKPVSAISVTELCKVAGVQRNTFYSHYSIPGDLLERICRSHEEAVIKTILSNSDYCDNLSVLKAVCRRMCDDKEFFTFICQSSYGMPFLRRMLDFCKENFHKQILFRHRNSSEEVALLVNRFSAGGALLIINDWCLDGMKEEPDVIAEKINEISSFLIQHYVGIGGAN